MAAKLIDEMIEGDKAELMSAFAMPLPLATISELLGVPLEGNALIAQWSYDFKPALQFLPMDDTELAAANAAVEGLAGYFRDLVAERRRNPGDDLLSGLIAEADQGHLSDDEVVANAWGLYVAGHETSASLIGNAVVTFGRRVGGRSATRRCC